MKSIKINDELHHVLSVYCAVHKIQLNQFVSDTLESELKDFRKTIKKAQFH